jgi:serine protease Do
MKTDRSVGYEDINSLRFLTKLCPLLLTFCAIASLTGCVTAPNGFSRFYQDQAGGAITNLPPYSGETKIVRQSDNVTNDLKELARNNYLLIGTSAFQGPPQSQDMLMAQAKKVGADVVIYSSVYLGSQETTVPFVQYHPGESYTTTSSGTLNANAYGNGGYAYGTGNYYGNSTTTSSGTYSTEMIPITIQRYQYDVGYFRKGKTPVLGIVPKELPDEIRQQLQRNNGVYVWVVRNDTPAFYANILEGDVILKLNGENVESIKDFSEKLLPVVGKKVDLEIWRSGETKTISVQLNDKP